MKQKLSVQFGEASFSRVNIQDETELGWAIGQAVESVDVARPALVLAEALESIDLSHVWSPQNDNIPAMDATRKFYLAAQSLIKEWDEHDKQQDASPQAKFVWVR